MLIEMKSSAEYQRLELSPTRQGDGNFHSYIPRHSWATNKAKIFLIGSLTISVLFNLSILFSNLKSHNPKRVKPELETKFGKSSSHFPSKSQSRHELTEYPTAGLVFNTPSSFVHHGPYDSRNKTLSIETWNNLDYDLGSIALDYDYAASLGLPKAQEFPWDNSKGLYFLNAFHSLHCLVPLPPLPSHIKRKMSLTPPRKSSTQH